MDEKNRTTLLGRSLAVFGVLLMAINFGLSTFGIADGGGPFVAFAGAFFVLVGVALMFRRRAP